MPALFSAKTLIIWKFTNSSAKEIDILFSDTNVFFFYR